MILRNEQKARKRRTYGTDACSSSDNSRNKDDAPGDFRPFADGGTNDVYDISAIDRTSRKSNDCESKPSMSYWKAWV
jgi:hypothetical protein